MCVQQINIIKDITRGGQISTYGCVIKFTASTLGTSVFLLNAVARSKKEIPGGTKDRFSGLLVRKHNYAGLINAPKAYGRKRNFSKNLQQRVCGISRGSLFFFFLLPFGERKSRRDRARYAALVLYRAPLRARRTPSERLRLVSKSHLTLTWGGVMNQHDLRFAGPCSCLIETSVAHSLIRSFRGSPGSILAA